MEPEPVRRSKNPRYPTRPEVLEDPGLLARSLPPSWLRDAAVAGAVGAFLAIEGSGCSRDPAAPGAAGPAAGPPAGAIAPIFVHGEGRGAFGCVVVSPPVFLSEEEALQVIREELSAAGLEVSRPGPALQALPIAKSDLDVEDDGDGRKDDGKHDYRLDVADPGKNVAVDYISMRDHDEFGPGHFGTVSRYDFLDAARRLREGLGGKVPGLRAGIFYDPLVRPDRQSIRRAAGNDREAAEKAWREASRQGGIEARRLLRLQVKDFVDWLKAQGAI